jgi:hypothetical protein
MIKMSYLSSEVLSGDLMFPFYQQDWGRGHEESLGLSDDY